MLKMSLCLRIISCVKIWCAGAERAALPATISRADSLSQAAEHAFAEVLEQDEHSTEWRTQRKHFFVLSNAGALPIVITNLPSLIFAIKQASFHAITPAVQPGMLRESAGNENQPVRACKLCIAMPSSARDHG